MLRLDRRNIPDFPVRACLPYLSRLFRREYLICALRRNIIKDISFVVGFKIVRKLGTFPHKLLHGIIKYNFIKQVPVKVLLFPGFCRIVSAVS